MAARSSAGGTPRSWSNRFDSAALLVDHAQQQGGGVDGRQLPPGGFGQCVSQGALHAGRGRELDSSGEDRHALAAGAAPRLPGLPHRSSGEPFEGVGAERAAHRVPDAVEVDAEAGQ